MLISTTRCSLDHSIVWQERDTIVNYRPFWYGQNERNKRRMFRGVEHEPARWLTPPGPSGIQTQYQQSCQQFDGLPAKPTNPISGIRSFSRDSWSGNALDPGSPATQIADEASPTDPAVERRGGGGGGRGEAKGEMGRNRIPDRNTYLGCRCVWSTPFWYQEGSWRSEVREGRDRCDTGQFRSCLISLYKHRDRGRWGQGNEDRMRVKSRGKSLVVHRGSWAYLCGLLRPRRRRTRVVLGW